MLFDLLDNAAQRDKVTARLIHFQNSAHLRSSCEKAYASLVAAHPGLLPEMSVMRTRFEALKKSQESELRLKIEECCESLGMVSLPADSLAGKTWLVAESLINISDLTDLELEAKAEVRQTWQSLQPIFRGSEILSSLSLDLASGQRRRLWAFLSRPFVKHPDRESEPLYTRSLVLGVLRTCWPGLSPAEASHMAKNLDYAAACAISDCFWKCNGITHRCGDLSSARLVQYNGLSGLYLNVGGWKQMAQLGRRIRTQPGVSLSEEVFLQSVLDQAGIEFTPRMVEPFIQTFVLMRAWSDCEEGYEAAKREYFRISTAGSRLWGKIKFPVRASFEMNFTAETDGSE